MKKRCSYCKKRKDASCFHKNRNAKDQLQSRCKPCAKATWQPTVKSQEQRQKERYWHLLTRYGMTGEDYAALLTRQGGCCAICKRDKPDKRCKNFHVDHDHRTGKIRGLLCSSCNRTLGNLGDTLSSIMRFVDYLRATGET